MMNKLLKYLAYIVVCPIFVLIGLSIFYCCMAFVSQTFNVSSWSEGQRFYMTFVGIVSGVIGCQLVSMHHDNYFGD